MYLSAVSLRTSHSLSFYWYLWCDAVWVRGLWQLTLQSGTWIVCCSVQSNNVFVSYCQMPYTPPFIFLCSIFCTTAKIRPTFQWQVGDYMRIQSHRYTNSLSLVLLFYWWMTTLCNHNGLEWCCKTRQQNTKTQTNQRNGHVRGNTNINVSILHELCSEKCDGMPTGNSGPCWCLSWLIEKVDSGLLQLCTVGAAMCAASCNSPAWKPDLKQIYEILERLSRMLFIESGARGDFLSVACCISL